MVDIDGNAAPGVARRLALIEHPRQHLAQHAACRRVLDHVEQIGEARRQPHAVAHEDPLAAVRANVHHRAVPSKITIAFVASVMTLGGTAARSSSAR